MITARQSDWHLPRFGTVALTLSLLLAACAEEPKQEIEIVPPPAVKPKPPEPKGPTQEEIRVARAERNRAANAAADEAQSSESSQSVRSYYAGIEAQLLQAGELRRDQVPLDAPIDAETLADNFITIALHDEYTRSGSDIVAGGNEAPLRRWQEPVRVDLEFGASANTATQSQMRTEVANYASRLASITGHSVGMTDGTGNFTVLVVNDDERREIGPQLARLVPGIPAHDLSALQQLPQDIYCTVFAYSQGNSASYAHAVALIRAELPPVLRLSCIHEELAQGMGLANDDPGVRPSIFNDDEEFALLTRHDELLLKILYDARLRPGMTKAEAEPIVREIAAELVP